MIGNLEGTLATGGASKCGGGSGGGCYAFRGSPDWAAMLRRTGFMVMNVANNHAYDYGPSAQHETLRALRRAGLSTRACPDRSRTCAPAR